MQTGPKNIPFLTTHDGRTIRYPDPNIKVHDTIQFDIASSKILDHIRFEPGNYLRNNFRSLIFSFQYNCLRFR